MGCHQVLVQVRPLWEEPDPIEFLLELDEAVEAEGDKDGGEDADDDLNQHRRERDRCAK